MTLDNPLGIGIPVDPLIVKSFPEWLAVTGWAPMPDEPGHPDMSERRPINLDYRELM